MIPIRLLLTAALASPPDVVVRPDSLPAWASASDEVPTVAHDPAWWTSFGDPGLTAILERAVSSNRDIAASFARTRAAEAQASAALAPLLPAATLEASSTTSPTASRGFQFGGIPTLPGQPEPPKTFTFGSATVNLGWELDLFLKNQQAARASRHDALAAAGDRDAALLAFATRVAEGYFDVIAARERVGLVEAQAADAQELVELIERRYRVGDVSSVELLQQRQNAAGIRAQLPLARAQVKALEHQLAVALALPPATTIEGVAATLPELPALPDAGVPGDLVTHRPDLRAAEDRIVASSARRRNAALQLTPTVRVNGQAGWQFFAEREFISQAFWGAGASVSVPLFAGGRIASNLRAAKANEYASAHAYTQLAANAVVEVENALVLERERREHLRLIREQVDAAEAALEAARDQYQRGVGTYLSLLTTQNAAYGAQLALLDSRRQLLSARVQLHDALGGTWIEPLSQTIGDDR